MKLKCQPEDFLVEELPTVAAAERGRYTLYRLVKRDLGTIEAVASIRRRWNLDTRQVQYGGLKDRHAVTTQYLTIADGPQTSITDPRYSLEPLGRLPHPYSSQSFRGNRFELVLRDLTSGPLAAIEGELATVAQDGLPNYFDDQRFGSVGGSGQFIAQAWLQGEHERALRLALAEDNAFDRSSARSTKKTVRDLWGKWVEMKARLERSSTRSIITYLVDHPTDFAGAFARLPRDIRALYFSAFQSHLWNSMLARFIEDAVPAAERTALVLKMGTLPFPRRVSPEARARLEGQMLPFPSSRSPEPEGLLGQAALRTLEPIKLSWHDLRVRKLKDVFFSKGERACLFFPEALHYKSEADALHPRRKALRLSFELGKGSYATILVKRISRGAGDGAGLT